MNKKVLLVNFLLCLTVQVMCDRTCQHGNDSPVQVSFLLLVPTQRDIAHRLTRIAQFCFAV